MEVLNLPELMSNWFCETLLQFLYFPDAVRFMHVNLEQLIVNNNFESKVWRLFLAQLMARSESSGAILWRCTSRGPGASTLHFAIALVWRLRPLPQPIDHLGSTFNLSVLFCLVTTSLTQHLLYLPPPPSAHLLTSEEIGYIFHRRTCAGTWWTFSSISRG